MIRLTKPLVLIGMSLTMVACNIQEFANKILPETVKVDANKTVDAVLDKNSEYMKPLQGDGMSDEEFQKALDNMFSFVSSGPEIQRDIVGASYNTNVSSSDGYSKTAEVMYEVRTEDGYTLITLNYAQSSSDELCCKLNGINVQKYETSPILESMKSMAKIGKNIAIGLLIFIPTVLFFIFRYIRRERMSRS